MTYFCISDVHSYYSAMIKALEDAGYDRNNPDHKIVLLGDAYDRGDETLQMYNWLLDGCKQEKIIYIKGNHEDLMRELIDKKYVDKHDQHNRTDKSACALAGAKITEKGYWGNVYDMPFDEVCYKIDPMYKELEQYMVDYFEIDKYIFVHSWIPTKVVLDKEKANSPEYKGIPALWMPYKDIYDENWREAGEYSWKEARWVNPFNMAEKGYNQTGKTIVSGHWHCSEGWRRKNLTTEFGEDAVWDIFFDDDNNCIMIDKCTAHTGEVNVLVIKDEE